MQFKDLKVGYEVHLLSHSNISYTKADIISIGSPYFPPVNKGNQFTPMPNVQRIIDITICENGANQIYAVPESGEVAYCGDKVLAISKQTIIAEIRRRKSTLDKELAEVPQKKKDVERCTILLSDLDDVERERQANEHRLDAIEKKMESLSEGMSKLISKFTNNIV